MLLKKIFLASVLLMAALATDPLTSWPQTGRNYLAHSHSFLEHRMALEPLGLGPPNPGQIRTCPVDSREELGPGRRHRGPPGAP